MRRFSRASSATGWPRVRAAPAPEVGPGRAASIGPRAAGGSPRPRGQKAQRMRRHHRRQQAQLVGAQGGIRRRRRRPWRSAVPRRGGRWSRSVTSRSGTPPDRTARCRQRRSRSRRSRWLLVAGAGRRTSRCRERVGVPGPRGSLVVPAVSARWRWKASSSLDEPAGALSRCAAPPPAPSRSTQDRPRAGWAGGAR